MIDTYSVPLKKLVEDFRLEIAHASTDFESIRITVEDVARPGLQLAGYFDHYEPMRLQVMGNVEISYLEKLTPSERLVAFDRLFSYRIPALMIARDSCPDAECLAMAKKYNITILSSEAPTSALVSSIITYLKAALAPCRDAFDYIIIDCPPALGLLTLNALVAADTFLIPAQPEYYALEGLSQLIATVRQVKRLYNPTLELEGVLFTMYDGRTNLTQQVVAEVKKFFPRRVYATVIPRTVRLAEAPSHGLPILAYDRSSRGAVAYLAVAEEIRRKG